MMDRFQRRWYSTISSHKAWFSRLKYKMVIQESMTWMIWSYLPWPNRNLLRPSSALCLPSPPVNQQFAIEHGIVDFPMNKNVLISDFPWLCDSLRPLNHPKKSQRRPLKICISAPFWLQPTMTPWRRASRRVVPRAAGPRRRRGSSGARRGTARRKPQSKLRSAWRLSLGGSWGISWGSSWVMQHQQLIDYLLISIGGVPLW